MTKRFLEKLEAAALQNRSLLCVGLDADPQRMPVRDVAEFNRAIIDATQDLVCAYKPNLAFYEALGLEGLRALEATLACIPAHIPVIGDAKRGDIGNTAERYARAMFEVWGFDAVTASPFLGSDTVAPFLAYSDKGVFLLCRTSNPGAREFQDLIVSGDGSSGPLFEWTARWALRQEAEAAVGLVVGATYPQELARLRELCPDTPFLVPGVGAQEGELAAAVRAGVDARGRGAIINSSRQVLYASNDPQAYPEAARQAAQDLRDAINGALREVGETW